MVGEVDLEALELEVGVDDGADAAPFHGDDGADVVVHHAVQALDLVPRLAEVVGGAVQAHRLHHAGEDVAVAVELLQVGEDLGVDRRGVVVQQRAGVAQQVEAHAPQLFAGELLVEHLEQESGVAGVALLAGRDVVGDGGEPLDLGGEGVAALAHPRQPLVFEGFEVAAV